MSGHADTIRDWLELLAENQRLRDLLQDAIAYLDRGEFPGDGIMARNLREALKGDT